MIKRVTSLLLLPLLGGIFVCADQACCADEAAELEKPKLKAAFLFVAPEADAAKHFAIVDTPMVQLTVCGVRNYREAVAVAKKLVAGGIVAIELCGGFGHEGVAAISSAVKGQAAVGVVRFDNHPGLGGKSGDGIF
jgi:hypothetical protein